jgi:hypothetical protein
MFGDLTMDIKPSIFWFSSNYYFESFGWSYLFLSKQSLNLILFLLCLLLEIYIEISEKNLKG